MKRETENRSLIYLNTAAAGLLSSASASAAAQFQEEMITNPGGAFMRWIGERLPVLREKTAKLSGARPSQIAFTPNFSYSLLPVIQSIKTQLKKVLLYKDDYPSLNMPFELGGFDVHYVESTDGFSISLSQIKKIIEREKIEVVAISHVQFLTGFKIDLKDLGQYCKEKGIVLIVDATQSMGAINYHFDALSVDVLISSSYKWLNGGYGSAVLCIKKEFIEHFPPKFAGFGSMEMNVNGWSYTPSAKSFEPGHLNIPGLLQLEHAIDQRMIDGMQAVEQHNAQLISKLSNGLSATSFKVCGSNAPDSRASILCFEAVKPVHDYLTQQGFALTWRRGLIRVSPHFYNTEAEMEALVEALKGWK